MTATGTLSGHYIAHFFLLLETMLIASFGHYENKYYDLVWSTAVLPGALHTFNSCASPGSTKQDHATLQTDLILKNSALFVE